jgi:uncharacterized protein YjiK
MNKAVFLIVLGAFAWVAGIYFSFENLDSSKKGSEHVTIQRTWELPDVLKEISGIAYLENDHMACVQDEDGIIFIYDLSSSSIIQEIEFGKSGDYESITIAGSTAYVLRSDGVIFEIKDFQGENKIVVEHSTPIASRFNFEGMAYDKKYNRLLLAIKERSGDEFKPIYGFDLETKKLSDGPVYKVLFSDPLFKTISKKISRRLLRPSEITVHPKTGKIYILEGKDPKLLILNASGTPEKIYRLNKDKFQQAEGLTFGSSGELYISNEGNKKPANILEIFLEQ